MRRLLNKSEQDTLELFAIYQASKTNESVADGSKTGLCINNSFLRMLSRIKT